MKLTDLGQGMIINDQAGQSKYIISATIIGVITKIKNLITREIQYIIES